MVVQILSSALLGIRAIKVMIEVHCTIGVAIYRVFRSPLSELREITLLRSAKVDHPAGVQ